MASTIFPETQEGLNQLVYNGVQQNRPGLIRDAVKAGADINAFPPKCHSNPLIVAVQKRNMPLVRLLLELGADPNAQSSTGMTPLFASIKGSGRLQPPLIDLLFDWGADPNIQWVNRRGEAQNSILHHVTRSNQPLVLRQFLHAGADPFIADANGAIPQEIIPSSSNRRYRMTIAQAMDLPRIDVSPKLKKADLFAANRHGLTPLDNPVTWRQWPEITAALAENGETITKAELAETNIDGRPYIRMAADTRMLGAVRRGFNAGGESLLWMDIVPPGYEVGPFLQSDYVLREIFNVDNLRHSGINGLRASLRQMPPEVREKLPDLHRLAADVQRQERHSLTR